MELPKKSNLPCPPQPSRTSFSSLPEGIVLSILARISTSHYPKLSLVSRSFRSLIPRKTSSLRDPAIKPKKIVFMSAYNRTSIRVTTDDPDQHQTLACCMSGDKTTRNLLVPIPSSYSPYLPVLYETAGSDKYAIGDGLNPSSSTTVRVCNELVGEWREAPSMMVARKNAFTCSLNGKIYVMGGCESDESECWAEVFDPKTQTWEPLPDPAGTSLRFSSIKNLDAQPDRIYLRTNKKNFVYLIEEDRWEVVDENIGESECKVENTWYCYASGLHWWHDTKYCKEWRLVKGLMELDLHFRRGHGVEIVSYGRKLVIFWVGSTEMLDDFPLRLTSEIFFSEIWCAVVLLERRHDDEVWGQIEWVDLVLRVPSSHTLLRCVELMQ
ncbi:hypothetical protein Bca4012_083020 [Brassica carinata]